MGYAQFLKPRRGVITDEGVEGIIDLANIKDPTQSSLEASLRAAHNNILTIRSLCVGIELVN